MYPSLEEVKKIAASGEYRRIPVCRELYADRYTPVEVLRTLRGSSRHCYLLESASQTESWGRYSFLGCHPTLELNLTDGELTIRRTAEARIGAKTQEADKGPKRQAVCLNAGAALYIAGKAETMEQGVRMVEELIDSGAAQKKLEEFVKESNAE